VFDLRQPTTRAERRAARRAWTAHPYRVRRQAVRAIERGARPADERAAWAAVVLAAAVLRPRGPHWWQDTRGARYALPYLLAATLVLSGATGWSIASPGSTTIDWVGLAAFLVLTAYVTFLITLYRQCDRLVAPWTHSARR
jgi:hypothetical protein